MVEAVILSSLATFTQQFERCCRDYEELHIATAWCGDPHQPYGLPFTHLEAFKGKITATVGTAFNQTHPDGIEFFRKLKADLRVFKDDPLLFHPKVYLFSSPARIALFVGSSNLTVSGFYRNAEINVLIEGSANVAKKLRFDELLGQLNSWHSQPFTFKPTDAWLSNYRKKFARTRSAQKRSGVRTPLQYEEQVSSASWLTSASWATYYKQILVGLERHNRDKQEMFDLLNTAHQKLPLPWRTAYFGNLELRKIIGGYAPHGWFGNVGASGDFRRLLAHGTPTEKATVVNVINLVGTLNPPIDWDRLARLLDRLTALGPSMKVWSRLLCLVRPDIYCTVASPSVRKNLGRVLNLAQNHFHSREGYSSLLKSIHASPWFQSASPKKKEELEIWRARVAFMDAIFYEERY